MVSWGPIQSIALFLGPLLLPKAIQYYRSIQSRPRSRTPGVRQKTTYALAILFASGLTAFFSTLPIFSSENIFRATQSRLLTSTGVLLTRLSALRELTSADEKLRQVFDAGGMEARLLYARYGPDVLINCPFAEAGELNAERSHLLYATPSILAPHIFHLLALGIATSRVLRGKEGARWRSIAIIAGLTLATAELYFIANYDDTGNARSVRVNDIDFVYWKVQVWRGLAISTMDALLGWMMWLQATGRAFLSPAPAGERVLDHAQTLETVLSKVRGVGVLRNGSVRDAGLRKRVEDYWAKEGSVMKDVFEEPEVLEAQRNALRRLDPTSVGRDAEKFLDGFLGVVASSRPK